MKKQHLMLFIMLFLVISIISACGSTSTQVTDNKNNEKSTEDTQSEEKTIDNEKKYTIGVTQIVEHPSLDAAFSGFKQALKDSGFIEGENVTYNVQIAQGDMSNNKTIANNLVGEKVDLIFANSTPSAQAALSETSEIPVIFTSVTDPVGAQLVNSMEAPGGNVTGTTDTHPDAIPKNIAFIKEYFPNIKEIGTIFNSGEQNSLAQIEMVEKELDGTDIKLVKVSAATSAEVKQATESLLGSVNAIYIVGDNTVVTALESVIQLVNDQDLPLFVSELDSVKRGGFAAYGFEYYDIGYEAGEMAVKVLKGEKKPSEIPVQYPNNLKLLINKNAASDMGIEIKPEWSNIAEFYE